MAQRAKLIVKLAKEGKEFVVRTNTGSQFKPNICPIRKFSLEKESLEAPKAEICIRDVPGPSSSTDLLESEEDKLDPNNNSLNTSTDTEKTANDFSSDDNVKDPNFTNSSESDSSEDELSSDNTSHSVSHHSEQCSNNILQNEEKNNNDQNIPNIELPTIDEPDIQLLNKKLNDKDQNIPDIQLPIIDDNKKEHNNVDRNQRFRKRKCDKSTWVKNSKKILRNYGKEYVSNNKTIKGKAIKPPCKENCRWKCALRISQELRFYIFNNFWQMGDLQRQREFISSCIETIIPKYRYKIEGSLRKENNAFYFTIEQSRIRICKTFFKATLDVSSTFISTVLKKRSFCGGIIIEKELRGKHGKQLKISENIKNWARDHLKSIPTIEGHYTRASSNRVFISGDKTLSDLYRDYVEDCKKLQRPFINYVMYNRMFNNEFNMSFFVPKKDQCELCVAYKNTPLDQKESIKIKYDTHIAEKDLSREEKKLDKEKINKNIVLAVYDLQAVLPCPKGEVSVFYYKSKLNVYNLTIYEMKKHTKDDCYCYVWHEGEGHRGSNEIGTCVLKFLEEKAKENESGDLEIIFYSDNCSGQQKNRLIISLYVYALIHLKIKSITHKYLITGHTQNEGDSAHSIIERNVKRTLKSGPIYTPDQYYTVIKTAKKVGNPYKVTELCYNDFFDLKSLCTSIGNNFTMNEENHIVKLTDIKIMRMEKEKPYNLLYKTSYSQEGYKVIILNKNEKTTRNKTINNDLSRTINKAFATNPPIAENKKKDLLDLLKKNHIPEAYARFYNGLFSK